MEQIVAENALKEEDYDDAPDEFKGKAESHARNRVTRDPPSRKLGRHEQMFYGTFPVTKICVRVYEAANALLKNRLSVRQNDVILGRQATCLS